jgi:hypothetical protein
MRKFFAIAALLLASTAGAEAQYTFEYGGRTIRIDPDRGTISIPGVYDNSGRRTKRSHKDQGANRPNKQTPEQAKTDPQTPAAAAPAEQAPASANASSEPSSAAANVAPADIAAPPQPSASAPVPQVQKDAASVAKPAPPPVVATAPAAADRDQRPLLRRRRVCSRPTHRSACG